MGDLNGDGFDDVAAIEEEQMETILMYIFSMVLQNPTWDINSPDILIQNEPDIDGDGVDNYSNFKSTNIQNVGDIDADGVNDIAIVSSKYILSGNLGECSHSRFGRIWIGCYTQ